MSASATFDPRELRPPHEHGTGRAFMMALAMHALLFGGLWIGVAWKSQEPTTVEAELWSSIPQVAAPAPKPQPAPEPAPVPKVAPPPKVEPEVAKPDIALEKKREDDKRKLEEQKREQERIAQLEKDKKEKLAEEKKLAAEKKRDQERFDKSVAQLAAMAAADKPGTGDAARTSGPRGDASYAARIAQRIRGNTVFDASPDLAGNPQVVFHVGLDPAGYIVELRKVTPSGLPGFDEAVERAIRKSEPFPPDSSGQPPRSFDIQHRLKDR